MVLDVNSAREAHGLSPLVRDPDLDVLAAKVSAVHRYQRRVVLEGEGTVVKGPTDGPVLAPDLSAIGVFLTYEGNLARVTVVLAAAPLWAAAPPAAPRALAVPQVLPTTPRALLAEQAQTPAEQAQDHLALPDAQAPTPQGLNTLEHAVRGGGSGGGGGVPGD